ncbi:MULTISPECIES: hypothetical protein [Methylomonas]|uniref:hypothetical protein n=1 Tax=Methylomonas TaxID=416 RepID=UPI0012329C06|nr:hypothetical protein [Methylomonas rhizoryzae]
MAGSKQTEVSYRLLIFCALSCEAKPLIEYWRLRALPGLGPFGFFADRDKALVVSGIGKTAMAAAVAHALAALPVEPQPALLNLGVAGHAEAALGHAYLAHKITDGDNGKVFYPQLPFVVPCQTAKLWSLSKPSAEYAHAGLLDMEASGFAEIGLKFSTAELVHALKVVSDNPSEPLAQVQPDLVASLIRRHLPIVDSLSQALLELRADLQETDVELFHRLRQEFHFSVTAAAQLKTLLQRWSSLRGLDSCRWREQNLRSGKEVLAWLQQELAQTEFFL